MQPFLFDRGCAPIASPAQHPDRSVRASRDSGTTPLAAGAIPAPPIAFLLCYAMVRDAHSPQVEAWNWAMAASAGSALGN